MFFGNSELYNIMSTENVGLEYYLNNGEKGNQKHPDWLHSIPPSRHFGFLDSNVIKGRHIFCDSSGCPYFSKEFIDLAGDIFPKDYCLIPLGVK
jgi:hypothetical protein